MTVNNLAVFVARREKKKKNGKTNGAKNGISLLTVH